jgi:branched-subunit amino acid transport protein
MTPTDQLFLVIGMALVTFAVRYPVLAIVGKLELPPLVLSLLKYVPAAVLTAIIVPAIAWPDGAHFQLDTHNAYLIGAIAAVLIAWRTRNLLLTIVVGMATMWLWRALLG